VTLLAACANGQIGDLPGDGVDAGDTADGGAAPDARPVVDASNPPDATPPDAAPCIEGNNQTQQGDTCFMYFSTPRTWASAQLICQNIGADLAVSTSAADDAIFVALAPGIQDAWLAGTDATTEMTWVWITGDPFVYTNWRSGEPNDGNGAGEDCMVLEVDNGGTWDDRSCGQAYPHFCSR
jgi:hypothetical protein